jgi:hypothetical protein
MTEADGPVDPMAFPVRSAMSDRIGHALQDRRRKRRAVEVNQSSDSAHRRSAAS